MLFYTHQWLSEAFCSHLESSRAIFPYEISTKDEKVLTGSGARKNMKLWWGIDAPYAAKKRLSLDICCNLRGLAGRNIRSKMKLQTASQIDSNQCHGRH